MDIKWFDIPATFSFLNVNYDYFIDGFAISAKFTENDHEKVDRLMELHDKYFRYVP